MTTQVIPVHVERPRPTPEPRPPGGRPGWIARLRRRRDGLFGQDAPEVTTDRRLTPAYVLFALAALLYPAHQLLTLGRWVLDGTMWAEMATNYAVTAESSSLVMQLFGTDAGYIPLPQRLIATMAAEAGLPPGALPYVYTWSAIVCAALLVASVCLPVFRPVIASDGLRFVLAIALVLVPEFQTRTFINFTYLAVVPLAAVAALAAVGREAPRWAWTLPIFMLSKPGVLAVLPVVIVVGLLSTGRFRRIAAVSTVLGLVQVVRLAVSSATGATPLQDSDESPFVKLVTAAKYTVGFLGRLLIGPQAELSVRAWMLWGLVMLVSLATAVFLLRARAASLVVIGLSLVAFTSLIDVFTYSATFSRDMAVLPIASFDRRLIVAVIGTLFVAAGLLSMLLESPRLARHLGRLDRTHVLRAGSVVGTAVFAVWFVLSGWLDYAGRVNQPFGVPFADVSQWQEMSPALADPGQPVVCVPVDPFGWIYGRGCINLLQMQGVPGYLGWAPAEAAGSAESSTEGAETETGDTFDTGDAAATEDGDADVGTGSSGAAGTVAPSGYEVELPVPAEVTGGRLASLGLLVRPEPGVDVVRGRAVVTTRDGHEAVFTAGVQVPRSGGLVQFHARPTPLLLDVVAARVVFDDPVEVASADPANATETRIVLWMGQAGRD